MKTYPIDKTRESIFLHYKNNETGEIRVYEYKPVIVPNYSNTYQTNEGHVYTNGILGMWY
jgi:hypothetical protein